MMPTGPPQRHLLPKLSAGNCKEKSTLAGLSKVVQFSYFEKLEGKFLTTLKPVRKQPPRATVRKPRKPKGTWAFPPCRAPLYVGTRKNS
jgi:hypothetical protein